MCTFTMAKGWQRGTRQPDLMLGLSPPLAATPRPGPCTTWPCCPAGDAVGGEGGRGMGSSRHSRIPSCGLNWGLKWAELGRAARGQHHAGLRALPLPGDEQLWPGSASSACKPSQQAGSTSESCKRGGKQPPRPSRHAQDVGHILEAPVASRSCSPPAFWHRLAWARLADPT